MMAKYLAVGLLACAALTGDALQESSEKKAEKGEVQESSKGEVCCCVQGDCSIGGWGEKKVSWTGMIKNFNPHQPEKFCCKPREGCDKKYPYERGPLDGAGSCNTMTVPKCCCVVGKCSSGGWGEKKVSWTGKIQNFNPHQPKQFCCKPRANGCKDKYPHERGPVNEEGSCETETAHSNPNQNGDSSAVEAESGNMCAEPSVRSDCTCDSKSTRQGWQCSGCREKGGGMRTHWGYGCDFPCADSCGGDCDFIGDCECPLHCVRNVRSENPTNSNVCLNSRGECQACASGWFGLHCKEECPAKCGWSHEGKCTRGGKCYTCLQGWYGELCDKQCPPACPECMMKDGEVKGQPVEAGMCKEKCLSAEFWGKGCDKTCPEHCDNSDPSELCDRGDGTCRACKASWWGPECDKSCANCKEGKCNMETGKCEKGCEAGAWGPMCDKDCTETKCHRQQCESDGDKYKCVEGCEVGYFGEDCEQPCSQFCEGGCAEDGGVCNACVSGRTGSKCKETCHHRCNACTQVTRAARVFQFQSSGTADGDCTICHPTEPVALKDDMCECIKGATFEESNNKCFCNEPKDALGVPDHKREAFFEIDPVKNCRFKCKSNYNGKNLVEVFDEKNQKSECIDTALNRAVIIMGKVPGDEELGTNDCKADELFISGQCLGKGYVKYILKE